MLDFPRSFRPYETVRAAGIGVKVINFKFVLAGAIFVSLLGIHAAKAELRSWVCELSPSASVLLPARIDVKYDNATWNTVVIDSVIEKYVGNSLKAKVTKLRNGTVIYEWDVTGLPLPLVRSSVFFYSLKIDPAGKAFLEGNADGNGSSRRFQAGGQCS